jgi:hypothetical protein
LHLDKGFSGAIVLDLDSFLARSNSVQDLEVDIGGRRVATARFTSAARRQHVRIPLGPTTADVVHVTLKIPGAASPRSVGKSPDARLLGVALYGIKLTRS